MRVLQIGAGVVGSATGKGLEQLGHEVCFVDANAEVVRGLGLEGYSAYSPSDYAVSLFAPEIALISVPTPSLPDGQVDLSYLAESLDFCGSRVIRRQADERVTVVVRSTVLPGTTRNRVIPTLESASGRRHGEGFSVCFNPEFLRAASATEDFLNPWIVVVGVQDNLGHEAIQRLYSYAEAPLVVTDLETAEMVKYTSNCFNAAKISYANETWLLSKQLGLDGNRVLRIAQRAAEGYWNPQYGTFGGQPFGGTCLPKDAAALLSFGERLGIDLPLVRAVTEVNRRMEKMADNGQILRATPEPPLLAPEQAATAVRL